MPVDLLGIAPTLLYKIDFTVESGKEDDLEATSFTYDLKIWFDIDKVRLVVKDPATAAIWSTIIGAGSPLLTALAF